MLRTNARRRNLMNLIESLEPRQLLAAELVKDINALGAPSDPRLLTDVNGTLFFVARDSVHGDALWKTNGTSAGTVMLKDPNPNPNETTVEHISNLFNFNGALIFLADDGVNGWDLWTSDGTAVGTVKLKDLPSTTREDPRFLAAGETLYFIHNTDLWKTDGTANGTVPLKGKFSFNAGGLNIVANNTLFFTASDSSTNLGTELWKTDGTEAGTVMVKDIVPGPDGSYPSSFVNLNGSLLFSAAGDLWKTDGTEAGTVMVKDLPPVWSSYLRGHVLLDGALLFFTSTALWKTDGTEAGTVMLKEGMFGVEDGPRTLTTVNGQLVFSTVDSHRSPVAIWTSDGTEAGTVVLQQGLSTTRFFKVGDIAYFMGEDHRLWKTDGRIVTLVKDFSSFDLSSAEKDANHFIGFNGSLYFEVNDPQHGRELWTSRGDEASTQLVRDLHPGPASAFHYQGPDPVVSNGLLYFAANNGAGGMELWKTDGTATGPAQVKNISTGTAHASPAFTATFNGKLFFGASDGLASGLWKTDGTPAGTELVASITVASNMVQMGPWLYFGGKDASGKYKLLRTDGTPAGTQIVYEQRSWNWNGSGPSHLINVDDTLFFLADIDGNHIELWKSNGTTAGTVPVKDIRPGMHSAFRFDKTVPYHEPPENPFFITVNGMLYFLADDGIHGRELWKTDGTPQGTVMVKDIAVGSGTPWSTYAHLPNGSPNYALLNGTLYFTASDGIHGTELWKTDGTEQGTVIIDINPGSAGSSPQETVELNGYLYFFASNSATGVELWRSDGTAAGASLVKDINPGTGLSRVSTFSPLKLIKVNNTLFFGATDGVHGYELWKSDGTEAGTMMVKDLNPGPDNSLPRERIAGDGVLYFLADNGTTGIELWQSDGTEAGTVLAADLRPGLQSSFGGRRSLLSSTELPSNLTFFNHQLFFTADDGYTGHELWTLIPSTVPDTASPDTHTLRMAPAGPYLQLFTNMPTTAQPTHTLAPSTLPDLTLSALGHDTLTLDLAHGHPLASTTLHLTAGHLTLATTHGPKVFRTAGLALAPNTTLDLADTTLVLSATPETRQALLTQLQAWIRSARHTGRWDGPGLTSSLLTSNSHLNLAAVFNRQADGTLLDPAEAPDAILVRTALTGDTNLDGCINLSDYFAIDSGYLNQRQGFANGDVNYDGEINLTDYTLIDSAYLNQSQLAQAGSSRASRMQPSRQREARKSKRRPLLQKARRPVQFARKRLS